MKSKVLGYTLKCFTETELTIYSKYHFDEVLQVSIMTTTVQETSFLFFFINCIQ